MGTSCAALSDLAQFLRGGFVIILLKDYCIRRKASDIAHWRSAVSQRDLPVVYYGLARPYMQISPLSLYYFYHKGDSDHRARPGPSFHTLRG